MSFDYQTGPGQFSFDGLYLNNLEVGKKCDITDLIVKQFTATEQATINMISTNTITSIEPQDSILINEMEILPIIGGSRLKIKSIECDEIITGGFIYEEFSANQFFTNDMFELDIGHGVIIEDITHKAGNLTVPGIVTVIGDIQSQNIFTEFANLNDLNDYVYNLDIPDQLLNTTDSVDFVNVNTPFTNLNLLHDQVQAIPIFDQSLNTTNNVNFADVTSSGRFRGDSIDLNSPNGGQFFFSEACTITRPVEDTASLIFRANNGSSDVFRCNGDEVIMNKPLTVNAENINLNGNLNVTGDTICDNKITGNNFDFGQRHYQNFNIDVDSGDSVFYIRLCLKGSDSYFHGDFLAARTYSGASYLVKGEIMINYSSNLATFGILNFSQSGFTHVYDLMEDNDACYLRIISNSTTNFPRFFSFFGESDPNDPVIRVYSPGNLTYINTTGEYKINSDVNTTGEVECMSIRCYSGIDCDGPITSIEGMKILNNPVSSVSQSTQRDQREFPIGTILAVNSTTIYERNSEHNIYIDDNDFLVYNTFGQASEKLWGNWRTRGRLDGGNLFQRVS